MKTIHLYNSKLYTLVDEEDFNKLSGYRWCASRPVGGHIYAEATIRGKKTRMHRMILKAKKEQVVDHIDNNGLNNVKANIRLCSQAQNMRNRKISSKNVSGVTGVYMYRKKWRATICVNFRNMHLGCYSAISDAITARKMAEIQYFGEFASTL